MLLSPFRLLLLLSDRLRHQRRKRIWHADLASGRRGEDIAHRYLRRRGYTIIARNYRARSGVSELDIIAREGETVAIVEVKTRSRGDHGPPERAIGSEKRRKLFRGAREYVRRCGADWSHVRFDIITVVLTDPPAIEHYRDVFPLSG